MDNLVSQLQTVNLSEYKKLENKWAKALGDKKQVSVDVDVKYDGEGLRPVEFVVEYKINGKRFLKKISN